MSLTTAFKSMTGGTARLEASWGRRTELVEITSDFVSALQGITIERIIETKLLRHPYFAFRLNGQRVPLEGFTESRTVLPGSATSGYLDEQKARSLIDSGATAVFYRVDHWHQPLSSLTAGIALALRSYCGATVFFTPRGSLGLPWHRDPLHVISVQISGSKKWLVEKEAPAGQWTTGDISGGFPSDSHEIETCTLYPGQAIYMPPGVAHTVNTTDEPSTHLSLIIREPDTAALSRALFKSAAEKVQTALDKGPTGERRNRAQRIFLELAQAIHEADVDELLIAVEEQSIGHSGLRYLDTSAKGQRRGNDAKR